MPSLTQGPQGPQGPQGLSSPVSDYWKKLAICLGFEILRCQTWNQKISRAQELQPCLKCEYILYVPFGTCKGFSFGLNRQRTIS